MCSSRARAPLLHHEQSGFDLLAGSVASLAIVGWARTEAEGTEVRARPSPLRNMLALTTANKQLSGDRRASKGVKRRRTELDAGGEEDAAPCAAVTPPSNDEGAINAPPFGKTVGFSERPTVRTFVVCNEEASSRRALSRSIKIAVKRARSGAASSELAPFRSRIRELVTVADARVYTLKALREDLEAETDTDLSLPALKRELKTEMQQVLIELSGGTLRAVD